MFMINKDGVPRQHMYYHGLSMLMINKDGFFDNICLIVAILELFPIGIPAESKRAEKMLEPTDEGS